MSILLAIKPLNVLRLGGFMTNWENRIIAGNSFRSSGDELSTDLNFPKMIQLEVSACAKQVENSDKQIDANDEGRLTQPLVINFKSKLWNV